jgi:hypothetical protein
MKTKKIQFISLSLLVVFILACSFMQESASSALKETTLPMNSSTPSPTITRTLRPSQTPSPTNTVTYTSTAYPNPREFDAGSIVSVTPGVPAQCPVINPEIKFDSHFMDELDSADIDYEERRDRIYAEILGHLNADGSFQAVIDGFKDTRNFMLAYDYSTQDVTGDQVDEIIYTKYGENIVLGCVDNEYQVLGELCFDMGSDSPPQASFLDTNNNGLMEVVVTNTGCMGGKCFEVAIYEWDGIQFNDLLGWECANTIITPKDYAIEDIDNNGTLEVVFNFGTWVYMNDIINYPLREETLICMWDGEAFYPAEDDFSPLIYRFQAVRDGDRQLELGHYERAIEFFNQAINDETLEWYTEERREVEFYDYTFRMYGVDEPNPTATPMLFADPDEYPILASISYYRIVMIYLLLDDLPAAESTYTKMESAFPSDYIGNHFKHMANLLLESYRETADIHQACSTVLDYASVNIKEINDQWMYTAWTRWAYPGNKICPY